MSDGYQPRPEYANQKNSRTVKFLLYTTVPDPSKMKPGEVVPNEVLYRQGTEIPLDQIDDYNLRRGETLGAFFTDAELDVATEPKGEQQEAQNFSEMGEVELAEYIRENKPNVGDTVDMAGGDVDTAKRLLEAEHMATDGDPRSGVINGLNAIIEKGNE